MLKKLFGGKQEFYLQIDKNQEATPEQAPAPVAVVAPEAAPAPSKKTSVKSKKKAAQETAPAPAPAVVAPKAPAKVKPSQVAFASADPIPQNIARRTPGPSLNRFKAMARQVKTR